MMRYWGFVFCFCLWGWGVQGQPEVALKQLLETPGLNHAAIGISVKKVGDGTTVLTHQAGMALTPASVTKLLPTVFALQERGKDFRFKTRVGYTGKIQDGTLTGDLILVAAGDPTLESRYFPNHSLLSPIVTALEKAGIQTGYSNSRTCEIGLTTNTGIAYVSIAYLVDECTKAR